MIEHVEIIFDAGANTREVDGIDKSKSDTDVINFMLLLSNPRLLEAFGTVARVGRGQIFGRLV